MIRVEGTDGRKKLGYLREVDVVDVGLVHGGRLSDAIGGGADEREVRGIGSVGEG